MSSAADTLKKLPLFKDMPENLIAELTEKLEEQRLDGGQVLFHKGDPGDALYIIESGRMKVIATNSYGEEVVLNQFGPGESFGEMSLVDEQPRSASAVALTSIKMLRLNRNDFLAVIAQEPAFALDIIRDLSAKLRFAAAYIQKATEWSQYIARGDYNVAMGEIQTTQSAMSDKPESDEARAGAFLSAFFQMIEGVKEREENLKREVLQLRIEIDEAKRKTEVEQIEETAYFQQLREKVRELRESRKEEG
ncbi:MAG: cyclic nucleotide-binding domain-containing protein [Chloroflexi bacterium]|nr:cyclic nucleotide-binding domain-containing protein [Chloroflexota bacterium]MCI0578649.1 cyclic nucleotide-binding domain-containing protein [Chloroflexota bacterium]MCI0647222.1 cyclic nucleotide-binding domain-containing protein [Chloroflexota bacterium]MCI0728948.1 cyclic nucleotide-binding domain-containing protein [Chloroflexota bacterium]